MSLRVTKPLHSREPSVLQIDKTAYRQQLTFGAFQEKPLRPEPKDASTTRISFVRTIYCPTPELVPLLSGQLNSGNSSSEFGVTT
jgi:hypothetical protein